MTPERDGATQLTPAFTIVPATLAADGTPVAIDMRGYRSATVLIGVGVGGITFSGTNKVEFVAEHSEDGSTYSDLTDDDVIKDAYAPSTITDGIVRALTAAHAAATIQKLGYIGGQRYLKVTPDFSGTHGTGTPIFVLVLLSNPAREGAA